jgi:hypothetical protein
LEERVLKVKDFQEGQDVDLIVKVTTNTTAVVAVEQVGKDILLQTIVMNTLQQTVALEWPLTF